MRWWKKQANIFMLHRDNCIQSKPMEAWSIYSVQAAFIINRARHISLVSFYSVCQFFFPLMFQINSDVKKKHNYAEFVSRLHRMAFGKVVTTVNSFLVSIFFSGWGLTLMLLKPFWQLCHRVSKVEETDVRQLTRLSAFNQRTPPKFRCTVQYLRWFNGLWSYINFEYYHHKGSPQMTPHSSTHPLWEGLMQEFIWLVFFCTSRVHVLDLYEAGSQNNDGRRLYWTPWPKSGSQDELDLKLRTTPLVRSSWIINGATVAQFHLCHIDPPALLWDKWMHCSEF